MQVLSRAAAENEDREAWTTGDYALQLDGLDDDPSTYADDFKGAPGLHTRLMEDLTSRLGVKKEDVIQIELGRYCQNETNLLFQLYNAQQAKEELQGRSKKLELEHEATLMDKIFLNAIQRKVSFQFHHTI